MSRDEELQALQRRLAQVENSLRAMRRVGYPAGLFLLGSVLGIVLLAIAANPRNKSLLPRPTGQRTPVSPTPARFTVLDDAGHRRFEVGSGDRGAHVILFGSADAFPMASLIATLQWGGAALVSNPAGQAIAWLGGMGNGGRAVMHRPRSAGSATGRDLYGLGILGNGKSGGELEIFDRTDRRVFKAP